MLQNLFCYAMMTSPNRNQYHVNTTKQKTQRKGNENEAT